MGYLSVLSWLLTRAMNSAFNVRLELSRRVARVIEHASFTSDVSITRDTTLRLTFPRSILSHFKTHNYELRFIVASYFDYYIH